MDRTLSGAMLATSLVVLLHACGSEHDALKKQDPPPATGGTAGEGGSDDATSDQVSVDAPEDAPADVFTEPPGVDALTLLHGVVDAPRIAFCFAKTVAGVPGPPLGAPLPPNGLVWGQPLSLPANTGFDSGVDDVQPIVVTGDFPLLAGKTCAEVVALAESYADAGATDDASVDAGDAGPSDAATELPPPPPARALALPVIPAGTLTGGFSNLLVATGCMGGPSSSDSSEDFACGQDYSPSAPTLTPVLVQLSRVTASGSVGMQVVNASRASDPISLTSTAPEGSAKSDVAIQQGVVFGQVAPKPPWFGSSKAALGSPLAEAQLLLTSSGSSSPLYTESWGDALKAGGLADLADGKSYAIVYVGPRPTMPAMKWWNGPRLVVIETDPG